MPGRARGSKGNRLEALVNIHLPRRCHGRSCAASVVRLSAPQGAGRHMDRHRPAAPPRPGFVRVSARHCICSFPAHRTASHRLGDHPTPQAVLHTLLHVGASFPRGPSSPIGACSFRVVGHRRGQLEALGTRAANQLRPGADPLAGALCKRRCDGLEHIPVPSQPRGARRRARPTSAKWKDR